MLSPPFSTELLTTYPITCQNQQSHLQRTRRHRTTRTRNHLIQSQRSTRVDPMVCFTPIPAGKIN
jgi:hypothetical protein